MIKSRSNTAITPSIKLIAFRNNNTDIIRSKSLSNTASPVRHKRKKSAVEPRAIIHRERRNSIYDNEDENTTSLNLASKLGNIKELMIARNNGGEWSAITIALASAHGHINIVKYLIEKGCTYDIESIRGAANGGYIEILTYLFSKTRLQPDNSIFECAVRYGQVDVVKLLRDKWPKICPEDYKINVLAVKSGKLEMVKYLRSINYPWSDAAMSVACTLGYFDIAKWLNNNGIKFPMNVCSLVAKSDNLGFYQWLHYKNFPIDNSYNEAAKAGSLLILEWIITTLKTPVTNTMLNNAAMGGDSKTLSWLLNKKCICNYEILESAIENGNLENLELILDKIPINQLLPPHFKKQSHEKIDIFTVKYTMIAAKKGNLPLLKWLRSKECPWDEDTPLISSINGNLDILQYSIENGCPCEYDQCLIAAQNNKKSHIVDWITEKLYTSHDSSEENSED